MSWSRRTWDTTLENPVGNRIPIGFLFDRIFIMITFVRGRSFVHGRVGGNGKGYPQY